MRVTACMWKKCLVWRCTELILCVRILRPKLHTEILCSQLQLRICLVFGGFFFLYHSPEILLCRLSPFFFNRFSRIEVN